MKILKPIFLVSMLLVALQAAFANAQGLETIEPLPAPDQSTGPRLPVAPPSPVQNTIHYQSQANQFFRIKDIISIDGDRGEDLEGFGLVMGLAGTGGKGALTQVLAENYFQRRGISVEAPETRAMSAVSITATISAYARKGEKIQVNVSVADGATSLRGGTMLRTPLVGLDGQVYAIAKGPILGGGIAAGGQAATVQVDHPTVGVCNATIEREICGDQMSARNIIRLNLLNKEYSTAVSIANAVNYVFPKSARALDPGSVAIRVPYSYQHKLPDFISVIGTLRARVDASARVVVNQKTGTIIMGQHVKISNVVFAKGSLIIETAESPVVSQPAPLSRGETVVLPRTDVDIIETGGPYSTLGGVTTVGELGRALNELGFTPNMMIEMFTSLKRIGALQAELIIE